MSTANNVRLAELEALPAQAPAQTNRALDRLAQHHRDQARIATLEVERGALLESLQWALRRIEISGLGCGEYWAKARAALDKVNHG